MLACQLRWRLGNWVCQLTKFLRAMCLGAFFPAPILLLVAMERLSWFGAYSAQLNTFSDHFQWRFHCLKSMRLCLVSGDSFRGTFGRTGKSLLTGVVCALVLGPNLQCIASIEDYIASFCMGGPAAGLKLPRSTNLKPFEKLFKDRGLLQAHHQTANGTAT